MKSATKGRSLGNAYKKINCLFEKEKKKKESTVRGHTLENASEKRYKRTLFRNRLKKKRCHRPKSRYQSALKAILKKSKPNKHQTINNN